MLVDELFQAFLEHVRVDFRGRDVRMTQQLLHCAQIGAAIQKMAGEGVAQHMRGHAFRIKAGLLARRSSDRAQSLAA